MKEPSRKIIVSAERLFELGIQIEKTRLEVVRLREHGDKSALAAACERYLSLKERFKTLEERHLRLPQRACDA